MSFSYVDDTATMDLDHCLMENKERHRSPIIHLPEIFMYQYSYSDVLECANNFRSNSFDKSDDPVNSTISYYYNKFNNKINPNALNGITDIIQENAYSIFHIGKDGTTYLASLKDDNPTVCIDSVCLNWNQLPDNAYDMQVLWQTGNKTMSFDKFSKMLFNKFHDEDYVMNRSLKNILTSNPERVDNFNRIPEFTYAVESSDDVYDLDMNEIEALDHCKFNDFELTPATEAPADDALNELENMSGTGNARPDNQRTAETEDDTETGQTVDIAQMTNDQMEADGEQSSEELSEEDDGGDAPAEDEGEEDQNNEEDTDTLDDTENQDEEDPDEKLLNDPETKETYRRRFVSLYKHINDVIDTLERFTPAYNVKCTAEYYAVQNDIHRLKSAIYKICTDRMKDMTSVDVMKAYLAANYAYDSIGQMLKDFFVKYRKERKDAKA
jgi:hypothetical protein